MKAQNIAKAPTGITGLDEILSGGLPRGRTTLIYGGAGSGKTLIAVESLIRGAAEHGEPGVLVTFDEAPEEMATNMRSLGHDLATLVEKRALAIEHVVITPHDIAQAGQFNLEALFLRIDAAVKDVGAKRIVLDSLETLFSGLRDQATLRAEVQRLLHWLRARGLTTIITGERDPATGLTRHGFEEYVVDCVIVLDHRVHEQVSTRRLRVMKYRGSKHGTNEYPFLVAADGVSVLPVTSLTLEHRALAERISTGVPKLDELFGGGGIYRGSTILVSGVAGTGKSSLAAHFVHAACRRGERALYFTFEESPGQIIRNMRSIGIDLGAMVADKKLEIHAARPTTHGLEMHLASLHKHVQDFAPNVVVIDPITSLYTQGTSMEAKAMATRLIDHLKKHEVTTLITSLMTRDVVEHESAISSLADTWIMVQDRVNGRRDRVLRVIKSRGMPHSDAAHRLQFSAHGIDIQPAHDGEHAAPVPVLSGVRAAQGASP